MATCLVTASLYLKHCWHDSDVIISAMACQITGVSNVCSTVCSGADKNIKVPRHWPLWGESTGERWIPSQRASNAENVSIWWRHHGLIYNWILKNILPQIFNEITPKIIQENAFENVLCAALNHHSNVSQTAMMADLPPTRHILNGSNPRYSKLHLTVQSSTR